MMKSIKFFFSSFALISTMSFTCFAWDGTIKTGQTLGGDGKVYDGASPEYIENLTKIAEKNGENVGVVNNNVYVLVDGVATFIPTAELQGKTREGMLEVVGNEVVQNVTGVDSLTLADFEEISSATGIDVANLEIIEQLSGTLDAEGIEDMMSSIGEAIDAGLATQINDFLSSLTPDEIGLLERYSNVDECLGDANGPGAAACNAMDDKMGSAPFPE